jgi:hypothetical protein
MYSLITLDLLTNERNPDLNGDIIPSEYIPDGEYRSSSNELKGTKGYLYVFIVNQWCMQLVG